MEAATICRVARSRNSRTVMSKTGSHTLMPWISHEELRRRFQYDPEIGTFTRLTASLSGRPSEGVGTIVGSLSVIGYLMINIRSRLYCAHRLAFFYMEARWPREIDHINRIRSDNRWCNLREADRSVQMHNRGTRAHPQNTTGLLGVTKRGNYFVACIEVNGKRHRLGWHSTAEQAHAAYMEARERLTGRPQSPLPIRPNNPATSAAQ